MGHCAGDVVGAAIAIARDVAGVQRVAGAKRAAGAPIVIATAVAIAGIHHCQNRRRCHIFQRVDDQVHNAWSQTQQKKNIASAVAITNMFSYASIAIPSAVAITRHVAGTVMATANNVPIAEHVDEATI